jgi:hypothetical protein
MLPFSDMALVLAWRTDVSVEPFASAQLVVSYCCRKFGALDFDLKLAQSCSTCSRAAGSPSSPVQHNGGRTSILLRLLRWRMASSLRSARARKLFQSGRREAACRGAADSGAHEKSRDHLHNLQQAQSDARQWIAPVAPARKGRAQGQLVSIGYLCRVSYLCRPVALCHPLPPKSVANNSGHNYNKTRSLCVVLLCKRLTRSHWVGWRC